MNCIKDVVHYLDSTATCGILIHPLHLKKHYFGVLLLLSNINSWILENFWKKKKKKKMLILRFILRFIQQILFWLERNII